VTASYRIQKLNCLLKRQEGKLTIRGERHPSHLRQIIHVTVTHA
jgi:hypothetical protein